LQYVSQKRGFAQSRQVADNSQPLYKYLGVAALIGIMVGLTLAFTYSALRGVLRLDRQAETKPTKQRTIQEYRHEKTKQDRKDPALSSPVSKYFSVSDSTNSTSKKGKPKSLQFSAITDNAESDY
jgi:hypothetical protein